MPVGPRCLIKVEDVQMVRAVGSGVAGGHYGFADLDRGEEKEGVMSSVVGEGRHLTLVLETGRKAEYCQQLSRELLAKFYHL